MRPRVLVVDDSLTVRMDIGEALQTAGFEAVLCNDLRSASDALAQGPCALVVLDIMLPDGDGLDYVKHLREAPATAGVPVLLLSSEAEVRSRVQGMDAGANEYIGKPYDIGQVLARARALTQRHTTGAPNQMRRIIIIDDSATFRGELRQSLESAGYEIQEAASGEEGLTLVAAVRPDAVVVDGILPGIDGATVVRRLKSDAALQRTPCLLLTAAEGAADELRALEAGADAYVRKSEDLGVILVRLAALLRGAIGHDADTRPSLLGPKRLLAVDDSITYLSELGSQLQQEGYDVVLAKSGEEALELLVAQSVDCILLDLGLPGLSGEDTCRRIKQSPEWRDVPLIMLTARDNRQSMIEGINAGADDYIAKSADFEVLKARLRAQLRRKHFEDENRRFREVLVRRETEARFQRLLHSNIIGVVLGDIDGALTDANDAFLDMLGYTRAELEAGQLRWDDLTPPECRDLDTAAATQLRKTGSAPPYEKAYFRKDGTRLWVVMGLVLMESTDRVVGFVLDQTELVRLRHEAQDRERRIQVAEAANAAKSQFLTTMSHELRTPLNAILGHVQLLQMGIHGNITEAQTDALNRVERSHGHLLRLISDLLDYSRIDSGSVAYSPAEVPLAEALAETVGVWGPQLAAKGLTLETPSLESVAVRADPTRLRQILDNLLNNAVKFTPTGGRIMIDTAIPRPDASQVVVRVRDTGIGIPADMLDAIFEAFVQVNSGLTRPYEGTGLGLAISRDLARGMGGDLKAESTIGVGSTFTLTLPSQ